MIKTKPKIGHVLDEIFRFYIKCESNWRCVICGAGFGLGAPLLDCSHFHRTANKGTKWHKDNCDSFCRVCHDKWERKKNPGQEYYEWKLKQIGSDRFFELKVLANSIVKLNNLDKRDLAIDFIKKIKELGYETDTFEKKLLAFNL